MYMYIVHAFVHAHVHAHVVGTDNSSRIFPMFTTVPMLGGKATLV